MRRKSRSGIIANVVVFALITATTAYAAHYALGDVQVPTAYSSFAQSNPSLHPHDDDGAEIYMTRCMSCHQANGQGVAGVFPPLTGTEWVNGDKGRLIRLVLHGLTGTITVGEETYSGAMPPWKSFLNDEEMAALLTYIRFSWGNDAPEVTPEEVSAVRSATEDRRDPWTQAELDEETNRGIPGQEFGIHGDESASPESEGKK